MATKPTSSGTAERLRPSPRRESAVPAPGTGAKGAAGFTKWLKTVRNSTDGGETLAVDLRLARQVREGYPTRALDDVLATGMIETAALYALVMPRRTLAHRKQKAQALTVEESDRFARVLRAYARAEAALGSLTRASHWLHTANRALQGERPIDLLGSDAGGRAVEKVLGRIEHGVFS